MTNDFIVAQLGRSHDGTESLAVLIDSGSLPRHRGPTVVSFASTLGRWECLIHSVNTSSTLSGSPLGDRRQCRMVANAQSADATVLLMVIGATVEVAAVWLSQRWRNSRQERGTVPSDDRSLRSIAAFRPALCRRLTVTS